MQSCRVTEIKVILWSKLETYRERIDRGRPRHEFVEYRIVVKLARTGLQTVWGKFYTRPVRARDIC